MPVAAPDRSAPAESVESAKAAGLIYVSPEQPGIRRVKSGQGFRYVTPDGRSVTDKVTLGRIKRLAIPPAWQDVWICAKENGHLQALGKDARGRKQYRYHPRWREVRDDSKYNHMIEFAKALPRIRARVQKDLKRSGLPREKVLATVIKILETGLVRVGNDEYARDNKSYGLTTMQDRHAAIDGSTIRFQFRGKSGKHHKIEIEDRRLAKIVANCQAIPGQELFQYIDENGEPRDITSSDVNEYLHEITHSDFTAKDFRTWGGTVLAAIALREFEKFDSKAQAKKNLVRAIEAVAQRLGNTPAVCKKCYIHPLILNSYLDGTMLETMEKRAEQELKTRSFALKPEEQTVLEFLCKRLAVERRNNRSTLLEKLEASVRHRKQPRRAESRKTPGRERN